MRIHRAERGEPMTVRELIELNQMITDLEITVRLNGSRLLDQLNIGCHEGVKPPYPTRVPISERYVKSFAVLDPDPKHYKDATYMPKSINAWDDGHDYWQIKINRIPDKWLNLQVISWDSREASTVGTVSPRRGGVFKNVNFHGEALRIDVLPSGESLEVNQPKIDKPVEDDGQLNIFDLFEGSEPE